MDRADAGGGAGEGEGLRLRDPLLGVLVEVGRCFGVAPGVMWREWTWPEVWGVYFALVEMWRAAARESAAGTGSLRCARDDGAGAEVRAPGVVARWVEGRNVEAVRGVAGVGVRRVEAGKSWKKARR